MLTNEESQSLTESLLAKPPPRILPKRFKKSSLYIERSRKLQKYLIWGILCIGLSSLPSIKLLAVSLVFLKVFPWLGLLIISFGLIGFALASDIKTAQIYLTRGKIGKVRVKSITKSPSFAWGGAPTLFVFKVEIEHEHPYSGRFNTLEISSKDYEASRSHTLDTLFRIGDEVLVIWLPGDYDGTITILDFLDALPDFQITTKESNPADKTNNILGWISLTCVIFAVFFPVYAFGCMQPINFKITDQGLIPLITGVSLGFTILTFFYFKNRALKKKLGETTEKKFSLWSTSGKRLGNQ